MKGVIVSKVSPSRPDCDMCVHWQVWLSTSSLYMGLGTGCINAILDVTYALRIQV